MATAAPRPGCGASSNGSSASGPGKSSSPSVSSIARPRAYGGESAMSQHPPCDFPDLADVEGRRRSFEKNGFFVLRQALALPRIQALREDVERVFSIHAR